MLPVVADTHAIMTVSCGIVLTVCHCIIVVCELYQDQFTIEAEETVKTHALVNKELEQGISYCIKQCETTHRESCVAVHMDLEKEQ